jgi:ornithine lipid hydroxylase
MCGNSGETMNMKLFLSKNLLLLTVFFSFGIFMAARAAALNLEITVLLTTITTLLFAIVLERVMPFRESWNHSLQDTRTDLTSAVLLLGFVDPLLKMGAPLLLVFVYGLLPDAMAAKNLWASLPFLMQLAIAILLIELGEYASHRLHHTNKKLWWLHAMHHSSERLNAVNNFRFHPVNYIFNFGLGVLPAMLIGLPQEVLLAYLAIAQPVLMLQHANIDLQSGWANKIFSTNELHRWHHSSDDAEANNNYGHAFVIWDHVFGTYKYKAEIASPKRVGLFSSSHRYPSRQGYFSQLRSVFTPGCCT